MCLVMTNPVDILAVRHVKQGNEAGGSVQDILKNTMYLRRHIYGERNSGIFGKNRHIFVLLLRPLLSRN